MWDGSFLAALPFVAAGELYRRRSAAFGRREGSSTARSSAPVESESFHEAVVEDIRKEFPDGSADWVSAATVRRMLAAAEGDGKSCRSRLQEAVRWRRDVLQPWLDEKAGQEQEMRLVAWGEGGRPMLYLCSAHQRPEEGAPEWAVALETSIAQAPDPMVQVDILFDIHGFHRGLLGKAGISPYLKLAQSVEAYFAERIHSIVLLDMPLIFATMWQWIRPLLPEKTRGKITFANRGDPASMERLLSLCDGDPSMREMVTQLLEANGRATAATGQRESHGLTRSFLRRQRDGLGR